LVPLLLAASARSAAVGETIFKRPATIKVLSADVFTGVLDDLVIDFERTSGYRVAIDYGTAGAIRNRVQAGEPADVVILPRPMLNQVLAEGRIAASSTVDFARSAVGVAVRAGASKPDVGSVGALVKTLSASKSISYPDPKRGGATGILFARVLERLGIANEMSARTRFPGPGQFAVDIVARGEAEIAIAQPMEILTHHGVALIGLLPPELQDLPSFVFGAGIGAATKEPQGAAALVKYLSSPAVTFVLKSKGMDPG
jgi:molybdate transport system substrate-binding protein